MARCRAALSSEVHRSRRRPSEVSHWPAMSNPAHTARKYMYWNTSFRLPEELVRSHNFYSVPTSRMPAATKASPLKKQIHLNFFETACTGNHECAGQWSAPGDNSRTKDRLQYYTDLARLAEKYKITCIFFADTYAGHVSQVLHLSGWRSSH